MTEKVPSRVFGRGDQLVRFIGWPRAPFADALRVEFAGDTAIEVPDGDGYGLSPHTARRLARRLLEAADYAEAHPDPAPGFEPDSDSE